MAQLLTSTRPPALETYAPDVVAVPQEAWIRTHRHEILSFSAQVALVVGVQIGDDIYRGNIDRPERILAVRHALDVVAFERAHGFFVEPAIQQWALRIHALDGLMSWSTISAVANTVYAALHLLVPLLAALWVYVWHRHHFPLLRNAMLLTNLAALVVYEVYPLAPPRLTDGLRWNGHVFQFHDTMRHVIGTGTLNGTPIGYNPFSAMPSLHIAWALIAAICVAVLAPSFPVRVLAVCYPVVMMAAVVVTGNHYFMDVIGAVGVVGIGGSLAFLIALRASSGSPSSLRLVSSPAANTVGSSHPKREAS